jgi:hypothetical protein
MLDRSIDPAAGNLHLPACEPAGEREPPSPSGSIDECYTVTSPIAYGYRLRAYMHGPAAAPSDTLRDQKQTPDPISVSECGLHNMPIAIDRQTHICACVPYGLSQVS